MSLSLEYLPLFIFVLTLTYKKKREREKQLKKKKHTQQQKECLNVGEGMVSQPTCHSGMERAWGPPWPTGPHPGMPRGMWAVFHSYVCTQHIGIRSFRHRFGAVVGTSHPTIGPFQMLCYHVLKDKLSGPEGHVEELVYFMWFPWWLYSYKREKKNQCPCLQNIN